MKEDSVTRGNFGLLASRSAWERPWDYPTPELEGFLLSRRIEGCSPATLSTYRYRLSRFLRFVEQTAPGIRISDITRSHIEVYLLILKENARAPEYIRSVFVEIRTFFNWCQEEQIVTKSPALNIKPPKIPKIAKPFLTETQRDHLLAYCPPTTFLGARGSAVIWLLWTTGMRFGELVGLMLNDLDWNHQKIRVVGKGSKERWVPFIRNAQRPVNGYLKLRTDRHSSLWVSEEGKPMTYSGMDSWTKRLAVRSGIKKDIKDLHHIFRRTWAMRQLRAGVPIKYVQLVGGWESVTTLERYVKAMDSEEALGAGWV